jgi:hypothetical protein
VNLAEATQIKLGVGNFLPALDVSEVWLGSTKIWPSGPPQIGQTIVGSPGERLGSSLAINNAGNILAAGAPFNSDTFSTGGAVKVFYPSDGRWISVGIPTLYGSRVNDFFGSAVAMNRDATSSNIRVAINNFSSTTGECKVFRFNGSSWSQTGQTLTHSQLKNVRMNGAGNIVALSGDDGLARVYVQDGSSWVQRGPQLSIPSSESVKPLAIALSNDGSRLAMSSHTAVSTGVCHIYRWNGSSWGLEADLRPPDSVSLNNSFGFSVSISHDGTIVAIGDPFAPLFGAGSNVGRVLFYRLLENNSWIYRQRPINGQNAQETFGIRTSLNFGGLGIAVSHRLGARVFAGGGGVLANEIVWNQYFQNTLESNNATIAIDSNQGPSHLAMSEFETLDGKIKVFPLF